MRVTELATAPRPFAAQLGSRISVTRTVMRDGGEKGILPKHRAGRCTYTGHGEHATACYWGAIVQPRAHTLTMNNTRAAAHKRGSYAEGTKD
jgi:hypothetical protein